MLLWQVKLLDENDFMLGLRAYSGDGRVSVVPGSLVGSGVAVRVVHIVSVLGTVNVVVATRSIEVISRFLSSRPWFS